MKRASLAAVVILLMGLGGCSLIRRGDLHRATEETAFIKSVEFRASENAAAGLPGDIRYEVHNNERHINIVVPYVTDTTQVMTMRYETVGDDEGIQVGLFTGADENNPQPWEMAAFDGTYTFNTGTPDPLKLLAYHPGGMDTTEQLRVITIHLEKTFYPVLLNPFHDQIPNPMVLRVGFVDETGTPIWTNPSAGEWFIEDPDPANEIFPDFDGNLLQFTVPLPDTDPAYEPGPTSTENPLYTTLPAGFELALNAVTPDEHWLFLPQDIYADEHGYRCSGKDRLWPDDPYAPTGTRFRFNYDPPPVYLSNRSGIPDDLTPEWGLVPDKPVATWADARLVLNANPAIVDVFIEGSSTPYDTDGNETIDIGVRPDFNVFGGFRPGFGDRYPPENNDNHGHTILYDSATTGTGSLITPEGILVYDGVTDAVLDRIGLVSIASNNYCSALVLQNNAQVRVNDAYIVASPNDIAGSAAVSLVNNTTVTPEITNSAILGKNGGLQTSRGLFASNARLDLSGSVIYSGESTSASYGIFADAGSHIDANWTVVFSGVGQNIDSGSTVDAIEDGFTVGIDAFSSTLNIRRILVQSGRANNATGTSIAVRTDTSPSAFINDATLVSGDGNRSIALEVIDTALGLYNSVLGANLGSGNANQSYGIELDSVPASEILNNAIYSRRGTVETAGIFFVAAGPPVDIANNLIWTRNLTDFKAISSPDDITGFFIRGNNIWSDGANAGMVVGADLGAGFGFYDLKHIQNNVAGITGNVSLDVDVNMNLNISDYFGDSHNRLGRVRDPVPDDIRFGGADLRLSHPSFPYEFPNVDDKRDRRWHPRTGNDEIYWSIGPYEFEDTLSPAHIYVSRSAAADDNHPLGTREAPFASLAQAYIAARTGIYRWDVWEIRVESGDWDVGSSGVPLPVMSDDVAVTGGWNSSFSTRSPRSSVLYRTDNAAPILEITGGAGNGFRLDGFTIQGRNAAGSGLSVTGGASPAIVNNRIDTDMTHTGTWKGMEIVGGSWPYVNGNTISGTASPTSTANISLVIDDSNPDIHSNVIDGGAPNGGSTALQIAGASFPWIRHNTVTGGDVPGGIISTAVQVNGTSGPNFEDNTIRGGSGQISIAVDLTSSGFSGFWRDDIQIGSGLTDAFGVNASGGGPSFGEVNVSGGTAGNTLYGMRFTNPAGANIWDSDILPGSADDTVGIQVNNTGMTIDNSRIRGGSAAIGSATGIMASAAPGMFIAGSDIRGGSGPATIGARMENSPGSEVSRNRIFGGHSTTGGSIGLYLINPDNSVILNNQVHGGADTPSDIRGIMTDNASNLTLFYSNTVYSGNSSGAAAAALHITAGSPHVVNNLLIGGTAPVASDSIAYWQGDAGSPARFLNNLLLSRSAGGSPYMHGLAPQTVPGDLDLVFGGPIPDQFDSYQMNAGENPRNYIVDLTLSATEADFFSDNWRLSGGGTRNATSGGYDMNGDLLYAYSWDFEWNFRDPPWSIGAWEY